MRINFFPIILFLLIATCFSKILRLADSIMARTGTTNAIVSNMFTVGSAIAGATPQPVQPDTPAAPTTSSHDKKKESEDKKPEHTVAPGVDNLLETSFNADEVKLLKELSKRREELDKYQQQLTTKESFLKTTQNNLEKKAQELKDMETKVNELMAQLDEKSNLRIKSLAKIYENMKPSEASKIFDELEMPLLLEIIRNMKEQKVAPIIAQMNPQKAKDVSLEFSKISDNIDTIKSIK